MTVKDIFDSMAYGPAPESTDKAQEWLSSHKKTELYYGGQWHKPKSKSFFASNNPANGNKLADIAQANDKDIDAAVTAAKKAQPLWAALTGFERANYMYALARSIQKHARLLAVLETLDNGKPIRETRDIDIPLVARHFYHHAGWAQLLSREFPNHEAVGVCGQIIPWNFPLLMLAWKIAPALATGNTVVLKPAEYTPLTALLFAEICDEISLPAGVVNIVTGDGSTGEHIVNHPDINKIAFTGSTEVGRIIRGKTAGSGKKLSLELGGKSPFIVFEDADLDSVVEGVVDAIWFNQGEVCCAGSRLLVQESVIKELEAKLIARMETLRIGDPLDKAIDIGAVVAPVQLEQITSLVEQGIAEGATCHQPSWAVPSEGNFYPPTLFTNVNTASTIAEVEIFGPVIASMSFRTPSEAVKLANNTRYGLAASIWTENINLALDIAPQVKAGVIWINSSNQFDAAAGFGGYRESGYGREGGRGGLLEYLVPTWEKNPKVSPAKKVTKASSIKAAAKSTNAFPAIDRTPKFYIGGSQKRPDSGYSNEVIGASGEAIALVGDGNRKDIRNAVEAAHKASGWAKATAHNRAQVLYFLAENLAARALEFEERLIVQTGQSAASAIEEINLSIERIFYYAAQADKYDGQVHQTPVRNVTLSLPESIGVMGILCPNEAPLLSFISLVIPAIAMGNAVVVVPSEKHPLSSMDFYQVLDTSDVPSGVINIITGNKDSLAKTLAEHDHVDAVWYRGSAEGCKLVEAASIGNLKQTWTSSKVQDWFDREQGEGSEYLRRATQIKTIWVPYGA